MFADAWRRAEILFAGGSRSSITFETHAVSSGPEVCMIPVCLKVEMNNA